MSYLENGVTGHRGNPQKFPQNTIESFESAIALQCDWVETDIHLTRDGRVVISHDADTRGQADKCCIICETELAQLRKLNMATFFNLTHEEKAPVFAAMPTLEEVLDLFRSQDKVRLSLQPKAPGVIQAAAKIIRQMNIPQEMIGFNDGCLEYMISAKQEFPDATIFYDRLKCDALSEDIAISHKYNFTNLVYNERYLTKAAVEQIADSGLIPGVWTVCNPGEMDRFIEMNVQRFYTDFPALLMEKIKAFQTKNHK